MVRKKLDERIRTLIERGVVTGQRSMLAIVGDYGKDQIANLHQLLSRTAVRARPSVLWCYKKELGFSTHRMKRMKKINRDKKRGLLAKAKKGGGAVDSSLENVADNFEMFISSTNINWCYYKDTHRVLGTTYGMLVLQDFEGLTPNLMARTIETIEGGGIIVFLMRTVKSLRQLYAMTMDVHARYRTEGAGDVVPRFNERFILSLGKCSNCLVCDDELNVLPISKMALKSLGAEEKDKIHKGDTGEVILRKTQQDIDLEDLKHTLEDTPHVGAIVNLAKTLDQAKALLTFLEACSEKTTRSTVALTAARGRGKSAAIGLCLAGAVSFGYSNIVVTAPEPENLVSVFDFILRGLAALKYQEHLDFTISYNAAQGRDQIKCVTGIEIHRDHRQSIKYLSPNEPDKFTSAELVAIDEAAAIPLPTVRALMGDRLTFMSSTVNGYEGTGRALSLKLLKELRDNKGKAQVEAANAAAADVTGPKGRKGESKFYEQRWAAASAAASDADLKAQPLREIELSTPIRYALGDPIESWLNKLLCLDSGANADANLKGGAPAPNECELYSVHRDALFSYHKLSEAFLQKVMGLYTSAHYKNSPNDLQMLSDAPAHSLFVLLSPSAEEDSNSLPDILAVIQVALEGKISRKAVEAQLARGHRSAGDLIPWTISQQFGDSNFAQLSGARIVRVAVHPNVQGMGYGSRAVELLYRFYNGEMVSLSSGDDDNSESGSDKDDEDDSSEDESTSGDQEGIRGEKLNPRKELPPLLLPLTEVKAPRLDWIGTSFGLTLQLHKFWKRSGMRMLYLRQTTSDLTGEHSAIMVRALPKRTGYDDAWLPAFASDSKRRIMSLLAGPFREMKIRLAISILEDFDQVTSSKIPDDNELANKEIQKRGGLTTDTITVEELNYHLTSHDLKRLELYGRNLCDHHLVTDLLSSVGRLYFGGRFGSEFSVSSLQAALVCGIGLQHKSVDELTAELGLPGNQVLAMFNKAIRKMSIALHGVLEENEKRKLLSGKARIEAELVASKLKNVSHQTLDEDAEEGAKDALAKLRGETAALLPKELQKDGDVINFAVTGTDEQWKDALNGEDPSKVKSVQIATKSEIKSKRKLDEDDINQETSRSTPGKKKQPKSERKPKKHKKSKRKSV